MSPKDRALVQASLPQGKTVEDALAMAVKFKLSLWDPRYSGAVKYESSLTDSLRQYCEGICGGDVNAGRVLLSAAIWET